MKIIITDIDTGEGKIVRVPAPRKDQYLADETVRARREFAIDAVILEGLKFIANRDISPQFIASPNSRQHIIDQRVVDSLNVLFDPQNEINNPPF